MTEKRMLIVSEEVVRRIDENRGDLGREEFIQFCIDSCLKGGEGPPPQKAYATREELRELERGIKHLLRSFLELFVSFGVELGRKGNRKNLEELERELAREGGPTAPLIEKAAFPSPGGGGQPKKGDGGLYTGLWVPAILLFGFGDTLTSSLVFSRGGAEANPILGALVALLGGSMLAFVLVKTAVLGTLAALSYRMVQGYRWVVPALLSGVGGYLVAVNLLALMRQGGLL